MAAFRHLKFLKYANFRIPGDLGPRSACWCKIWSQSVERLRSYCKLSIFNMAAVRHLGFVVRKRGATHEVLYMVFITVQNLAGIGCVVLIISKFNGFCTLAGNCLFTPLLGRFLGFDSQNGEKH